MACRDARGVQRRQQTCAVRSRCGAQRARCLFCADVGALMRRACSARCRVPARSMRVRARKHLPVRFADAKTAQRAVRAHAPWQNMRMPDLMRRVARVERQTCIVMPRERFADAFRVTRVRRGRCRSYATRQARVAVRVPDKLMRRKPMLQRYAKAAVARLFTQAVRDVRECVQEDNNTNDRPPTWQQTITTA